MARPNMKSVRLSDEALAIVTSAPGEGFNDKFERLIFDYKRTIPARKKHLETIEKRIKDKQKQFETLRDLEYKVNFMVKQLSDIANLIPSVAKNLNDVSQEIDQAKPAVEEFEIHPDIERYNKAFENFMPKLNITTTDNEWSKNFIKNNPR